MLKQKKKSKDLHYPIQDSLHRHGNQCGTGIKLNQWGRTEDPEKLPPLDGQPIFKGTKVIIGKRRSVQQVVLEKHPKAEGKRNKRNPCLTPYK